MNEHHTDVGLPSGLRARILEAAASAPSGAAAAAEGAFARRVGLVLGLVAVWVVGLGVWYQARKNLGSCRSAPPGSRC